VQKPIDLAARPQLEVIKPMDRKPSLLETATVKHCNSSGRGAHEARDSAKAAVGQAWDREEAPAVGLPTMAAVRTIDPYSFSTGCVTPITAATASWPTPRESETFAEVAFLTRPEFSVAPRAGRSARAAGFGRD
jgi:hypothetical protein